MEPATQQQARPRRRPGALIVGGAGAVGSATASWLVARGWRLALVDSGCAPDGTGADPERVAEVVERLADQGAEVHGSPRDVAEPGAAAEVLRWAAERLDERLDAVLWAAGIARRRSVRRAADEDLDAQLRLLRAALDLSRAAVARWADRGEGGALLLCVSPAGAFGASRRAFEGAADAALAGFVRGAAVELRRLGIRVNALAPVARSRLTEDLPMFRTGGRALGAEQVAPVAGFLLGEQAEGITGEVVAVAGPRVYAIRSRESAGVYFEGGPTAEGLRVRWAEVLRG